MDGGVLLQAARGLRTARKIPRGDHRAFRLPGRRSLPRPDGRRLRRGQGRGPALRQDFRPGQFLSGTAGPRPARTEADQPLHHPDLEGDGHPARGDERLPLPSPRGQPDAPRAALHPDQPHPRGQGRDGIRQRPVLLQDGTGDARAVPAGAGSCGQHREDRPALQRGIRVR
mgnify:CR=1 FL=1